MIQKLLLPLMMVFLLTGCVYASYGKHFEATSHAGDTEAQLKIGEAKCNASFWLFAPFYYKNDCALVVHRAIKNGGITKLHYIQERNDRILIFFGKGKRIVAVGE